VTDVGPSSGSFPLSSTYVHLGLGARAVTLPDFEWSPAYLAAYEARAAGDGAEGRLVMLGATDRSWDSWERHPAGDEVVVCVSGAFDIIQERPDGTQHRVALGAGEAMINPAGVWHTADVHEPGHALFITPGQGTEHRPRV